MEHIQKPSNQSIEAIRTMFGEHPEDVINPINCASDTLYSLEELFNTIKHEALKEHNGNRIKRLAEIGAYVAQDMANFTDSEYENMIGRLRNAGVVTFQGELA